MLQRHYSLLALVAAGLISSTALAQDRPPALLVRLPDAKSSLPVTLQSLNIDARIHGFLAETTLTMIFYNPHQRLLEGQLIFPLPDGATVSGYALDVGGVLVDGVAVEKQKAQVVFEKEVRKGVDPGLVEWTQGHNFRTRVYPLPPRGTRTVRVRYVSDLVQIGSSLRYRLPVYTSKNIERLSMRIEVLGAGSLPSSRWSGPKLTFKKTPDAYVAEGRWDKKNIAANLQIDVPSSPETQVLVEQGPDGKMVFCVRDPVSDTRSAQARKAIVPRRVTLLWDASRSRAGKKHKRELDLVQGYFEQLKGRVEVDLVLFHYAADKARRIVVNQGKTGPLLKALRAVRYDGGTQLAAISPAPGARSPDLYLLFSDGLSNIGEDLAQGFAAPLYAFTSGSGNNTALLQQVARQSGGQLFDLDAVDIDEVRTQIGVAAFSFLGATVTSTEAGHVFPRHSVPVHRSMTLSGRLRAERATVTLRYGVAGKVLSEKKVVIDRRRAIKGTLLTRFWAQQQLAELLVSPRRNHEAMLALGKRFGLVTPATSLMVLATLEQYVQHEIEPPASLKGMRAQYQERVRKIRRDQQAEQRAKIERVVELWRQRVQWWQTAFKYPKNFRFADPRPQKSERMRRERARPSRTPSASMAEPLPMVDEAPSESDARSPEAKSKKKDRGGREDGPQAAIALAPWQPNTPYVRAIRARPASKRYAEYLKQRAQHGKAPAFFLDCADLFRRDKKPALAMRILTNIAELELDNAALLRVLAHRLAQLGELELATRTFEEVLRLRPEEPQSYRDLALVLSQLQRYPRAMELLYHVVINRWDRFDEIELIALMELNRMIPLARKKGVAPTGIDKRLIKPLPLDVRIVMTWDADLTDMDLWVTEPSGEKAYYGHNRTTIGGLVSRDFTQGYGPEAYLLKKAMHGEYKVQTNFFGSRAQSLTGAVTLQLDIFTNYGRPNEKKQSITLRLTENKDTFTVGTVEF